MVVGRVYLEKESDFRAQLKTWIGLNLKTNTSLLYCSTDAILPAWAFALVAVHLAPHALKVIHGNKELLQ